MKAAVYHGMHDIRIEAMRQPKIGKGEALVHMKACGICGSDLMDWYIKPRAPLVLGHEPAGIISEVGVDVKAFDVGDRVFVHHHVACLTCHYCLHGDYTLCEQFHKTNIKPGGFAEYFVAPSSSIQCDTFKLPESISFEEATLIEPAGCCIKALRKVNLQPNDSVAIVGAGTTGIIHIALSKLFLADKVFATDLYDTRLKAAKAFGADFVINPNREDAVKRIRSETDGRGADIVVVTAPSIEAYKTGLASCRKGGRLCAFAPTQPNEYFEIRPKEMFFSETQIIPSYSTSHIETRMALELIRSGKLKLKSLITDHFALEKTAEAFKLAKESRKSLKIIVENEEPV
jgi:L-iditol 2-dehydrogenase